MVIAESTRKLLGNLFDAGRPRRTGPQGHRRSCESLGGLATRFGRKPLRGSARERIDRACWSGRRTRTSAAALVKGKDRRRSSGAAFRRGGIGKSRLTAALLERLATEPHTRFRRYFCSPQHTDSAFIRSSARWSAPPGLCTTTPRKRSSTSSTWCWRRPRPLSRTRHCSPRCCRCRTTGVIRRSNLTPEQRRQRTLEAPDAQVADWRAKAGADDLRGCALDRPHEPGTVWSGRGRVRTLPCAADCDVPPEFEPPWSDGLRDALAINRLESAKSRP